MEVYPGKLCVPDPFHPWPFSEEVSFVVDQGGVVENFMGVKIGDLNRSATAHLQGIHPRTEASASLTAVDRFVGTGEEFEVTLSLNDFNEKVLGGQWALKMTVQK
jgi:hypothetical protein